MTDVMQEGVESYGHPASGWGWTNRSPRKLENITIRRTCRNTQNVAPRSDILAPFRALNLDGINNINAAQSYSPGKLFGGEYEHQKNC